MRPFAAIVRVSLRQLMGKRRLLVLLLLGAIPAVVVWVSASNRSSTAAFEVYHEGAIFTLFAVVAPIVSIVLGAAAIGDERRDGTLGFLVVRPIPRSAITGAKLLAAWIASTVVCGISGALAAMAYTANASSWDTMAPTLVGLAIAAACYVAVFLVAGHLTSRAVLIGLVYLFLWETGIAFASASLANVSLFRIGLTAYVGMLPESEALLSEPLGVLAPGAGGALLKTGALALLAVAATALLLRRRDIT